MMTGYLLARAGIKVVVLEKHGDFLRDFRGDTVHPSTLELMDELGILDDLLKRPHQKVSKLGGQFGKDSVTIADFSYLWTKCRFIAFMPQWEFLNFLAEKAGHFPSFTLRMKTEATGLIEEWGRIAGVKARTEDGELHVRTPLVIGADGRNSIIRTCAGLPVEDIGAPMDVLWFRLSRLDSDPSQTLGRVAAGVIFIMINRGDYWQCGFVIAKGKLDQLRAEGLNEFRKRITEIAPFTLGRTREVQSWDDIKLLTVKVDRLKRWYRDGLLCIGDSAHAMSPIGGVGINLAIQDAVATANLLCRPLSKGTCTETDLQKVQARRMYPTIMTQALQVEMQKSFVKSVLDSKGPVSMPWALGLFNALPLLRAVPAAVVGLGFRPEKISTPLIE